MRFDFDVADMLHVQNKTMPSGDVSFKGFVVVELHAVAVGVLKTVKAIFSLESRLSRCLASFDAPKESTVRLVQPAQDLLQAAGVEQDTRLFAPFAEIRPLLENTLVLARCFVGGLALGQGSVVDLATLLKQHLKHFPLSFSWIQAVLICAHSGSPLCVDSLLYRFSTHVSCGSDIKREC